MNTKLAYELGKLAAQDSLTRDQYDDNKRNQVIRYLKDFASVGVPGAAIGGGLGYLASKKTIDEPTANTILAAFGALLGGAIPGAMYAGWKQPSILARPIEDVPHK